MPSREEIISAFKEAQETINNLAVFSGNYPSKHQPFSDLAAKVEDMQCETCDKNHWCVAYMVMGKQALGFGCFSHEPEEIK